MAANTGTSRGRNQDRAGVAGGQDHEVKYDAGKTGASKANFKSAVKPVGNSRKKIRALKRNRPRRAGCVLYI
ncbi:DUF3606 domain-containing protein [Mesorhizobium sp. WSM4303]|uniref:DUF3606 domain-containing protein n=1 Tax=unclassified Mesorhizobium TaxID=325217 RepID=UPI00115E13B0|nr:MULTISPECIES: DUF3606 domain-containing protein [unclassified Mesorhizobium]TRC98375.1 DUF3606 domain-containing protein [Mesorhizobium sp. WSM4306]TRD04351.1 DUF3606 domain-containing protein [Mesorhizobium sp. WSM4303]